MDFVLTDEITGKKLKGRVVLEGGILFIRPEGYGDCNSPDGEGSVAAFEYRDSCLQVILWPDINEEDNRTIDLEDANEARREK